MSRNPLPRTYFIFQQNFYNIDDGLRALANQRKLIVRLWNKYHNSFSALLVLSNVDGHIAERYNIREGQVGAPKWEYRLKPGEKGTLFKNFHLHIVFVGFYAATASEEFRDIMNANFWKKHPDVKMKSNLFVSQPAYGDGLYSKSYFMNQHINVRYVGDKKRLDVYDRKNPKAVEQYPEYKEELDLLLSQKKNPKSLAKPKQRNTHYINKVISNKNVYDNNSAGTAEAGTAIENSNIGTPLAVTPFASKTIRSGKYSYTYTPKANSNINTPAKRGFEQSELYTEKSNGLVSSVFTKAVNSGKHEIEPTNDKFKVISQSLVGTDGLLIDPRKMFDPLDDEDKTDWAELIRTFDVSPAWAKAKPEKVPKLF